VSTKDHNETLAGIHLAIGTFLVLGLFVSPWVIGHRRQIETIALIAVVLLPAALLMIFAAFTIHRKKPLGRKLALWSVAVLFMIFWPAAIYSWWFMHSEGAKKMYGVKEE
jgi:amino acid transporter